MICTSFYLNHVQSLLQALKGVELAEIRFEALGIPTKEMVNQIVAVPKKVLATCRATDQLDDDARRQVLLWAVAAGAAYVDLEVESDPAFSAPIIEAAQNRGTQVIISYHNYEQTPDRSALLEIVDNCFARGAKVAKVATWVNNLQDAARLLGLLDTDRTVLALGMGEMGVITRVAAPLLGAPFTFAAPDGGKTTAPGQRSASTMNQLFQLLNHP